MESPERVVKLCDFISRRKGGVAIELEFSCKYCSYDAEDMRRLFKILTSLCSGIRRGKGACLDSNNTESKLYTIHCILSIIQLLLCLVHWFLRNLHVNRGLSKKTSSTLLSRYKEICLSLCILISGSFIEVTF